MSEEPEKDIFSETRDLYQDLVAKAKESERKSKGDTQAGPLAKVLFTCCVCGALVAIGSMVYGIIKYPEAPIRQTASGYVTKHGTPKTQQDYESFIVWETVLFASIGSSFLTGFAGAAAEKLRRRSKT